MSTVDRTTMVVANRGRHGRSPQLRVDPKAEPQHRVVLTDEFGGEVHMSADQLRTLVAQVSRGIWVTND
jgi:hypothetical protein